MAKPGDGMLSALRELATTTEILIKGLKNNNLEKANEAVTILLMQGMDYFGAESVAMKQFFPVWDTIRKHLDRGDVGQALGQSQLWKSQLFEVMSIVEKG